MPTRNVNLTDKLDRFVAARIESGRLRMRAKSSAPLSAPSNVMIKSTKPNLLLSALLSMKVTRVILPKVTRFNVSDRL